MKINSRQSKIVELVEKEKTISVNDLAEKFKVSEVTIRKDLDVLNDYGVLIRHHGYATSKNSDDIINRLAINYDLKRKIAIRAASFVKPNETVLIGSGSTCALLAEEIVKTKPNVTIITHSVYIASHVSKLTNSKIILLGGEYQANAQVMVGFLVRSCVRQFYCDKIFLGTDGFVKDVGFMGSNPERTEAIKAMAESARNIIVVTDSSKFNRRGLLVQFSQSQASAIVTDSNLKDEYKELFAAFNIKVFTVQAQNQ